MKIAVPDLISNSYLPAPAAVELGFFEKEGLDMSYELIFPVDDANKALRDKANNKARILTKSTNFKKFERGSVRINATVKIITQAIKAA